MARSKSSQQYAQLAKNENAEPIPRGEGLVHTIKIVLKNPYITSPELAKAVGVYNASMQSKARTLCGVEKSGTGTLRLDQDIYLAACEKFSVEPASIRPEDIKPPKKLPIILDPKVHTQEDFEGRGVVFEALLPTLARETMFPSTSASQTSPRDLSALLKKPLGEEAVKVDDVLEVKTSTEKKEPPMVTTATAPTNKPATSPAVDPLEKDIDVIRKLMKAHGIISVLRNEENGSISIEQHVIVSKTF